jgi:hypothetical protein
MVAGKVQESTAADHELFEGVPGGGPKAHPQAVAPVSRVRSPILEARRVEWSRFDDERPSLVLPPLRSFVGPSGFALLIAAPILLLAGWQWALVAGLGASVYRELDRRIGRTGFSLGDGFLPYRAQTGWPQGVQEDDDVRWNWTPPAAAGSDRDRRVAPG